MSEASIQADILAALGRDPGILCWRQNVGRFRSMDGLRVVAVGTPGHPDIMAIVRPSSGGPGVFLGLEVKDPLGVQDPDQIAWQAAIERRANGRYVVVRSVAEAMAAVDEIRRTA